MPPVGVIFDMDGVLVDSRAAHLASWRAAAGELGLDISLDQFAATFGRTSADIIRALFGVTDAEIVRRIDDRKEAIYRDRVRDALPVMPGAPELITALEADGVRIAVGSSGPPENVELVCRGLGLTGRLSAVVTGRDVSRGKPDPQVFELAARRMDVEAGRCVVIEDAPVGIQAAARAGMRSIGLTGTHPAASLAAADGVVVRLGEVTPRLIRELIGRER
jgi:beta-phosphoglucomutase